MIIQNVLLPKAGICNMEELYFRREENREKDVDFYPEKEILVFKKQGLILFNTYFNGLSVEKWKKYTRIGKISLSLRLSGAFEVTLTNITTNHKTVYPETNCSRIIDTDYPETFTFDYNLYDFKGMLAFTLKALRDDSVFFGGRYDAEVQEDALSDVNIAINICTFKSEPFVLRNIDILKKEIIENEDNPLHGHLRVYISDNGKSLPLEQLNSRNIHVVYNKNAGGAAGFTRGLMEIMKHKEEFPATHALMMDDDIIIQPESLFRTYMMLRCRKEEYGEMFIGGAMLRLDQPNIQVESGASWNEGNLISNKSGLDVKEIEACLYNEVEEYTEYNAWWYCCTPMSVVNSDNLPLPLFIRGDDLEYGLRNRRPLVLLNGICVWHEAFENKYSSFLQYYILRNLLYDNALHFPNYSKTAFLKRLYRNVARELLYYRYKNVDLIFRGVHDFYKGVEFLETTDGEKLHKEIMDAGYKAQPVDKLGGIPLHLPRYLASLTQEGPGWKRLVRLLTGNGYLLPAKHTGQVVSMAQCRPINFYREKSVLNYDIASGKGFITEKNYGELFRALLGLARLTITTLREFDKAKENFRKDSHRITNETFWNKYLEIKS